MTARFSLVIFDVDGTLVDSQYLITACMAEAFESQGLTPPPVERVRTVVGLSLLRAVAALAPEAPEATHVAIVDAYKLAFHAARARPDFTEPVFPGVREGLAALDEAGVLLAVATGKSRRGLDAVLAHHGLARHFASTQTADEHPSKPHPAMVEQALRETGAAADAAVLVGDTTFDMEMAKAAKVGAIGVAWGYHPPEALRAAGGDPVVPSFDVLLEHLLEPGMVA